VLRIRIVMKESSSPNYTNDKKMPLFFAALIPLLIILLAIWLPYGFSATALIEEWGLLGLFTTYGPIFFEHINGPLATHALRPLMVFPFSLAYTLDPNSFDYWNVLTILSLCLRGIAASYLIWIATGSRLWAVLMGIIVLLLPADTMQLALRPLQINLALSLILLGSACCVVAYQSNRLIVSYILAFMAPVLFLSSAGMYEAACPLILLPFMVLYVSKGWHNTLKLLKSRIPVTLLWIAALAIYIIYVLIVSPQIHSYQGTLLAESSLAHTLFSSFPKLFSVGILRSLIGGWFDGLRITLKEYSFIGYIYLFAITAIISGFLLFIMKMDSKTSEKFPVRKYRRLGLIGILLLILGYAPFLIAPSHLVISQRTFLFATPGAAMVWIAFLAILSHKKKWAGTSLTIFLIFIGLGAELFQFEHYMRLSNTERYLLKNIVENFDGNLKNKTLVIFDKSNQLDRVWMLLKPDMSGALTYFYGHSIDPIEICYLPTKEWRSEWNSPIQFNQMGSCIETKNSWTFRFSTPTRTAQKPTPKKPRDVIIAKNRMIAITINQDGSITPTASLEEHRKQLRDSNNLTAIRYRSILTSQPSHFSQLLWATDKSQYKWHFGDWWSMELPIKGSGWNEAVWTVSYFNHYAWSLKANDKGTLLFDLVPLQKPYILKGKFKTIHNQNISDSMQIKINEHPLTLQWDKQGEFKASIPPHILVSGVNTIEFDSHVDPNSGLPILLRQFEILIDKQKTR